jgi:hypothetical protein
MEKKQPRGYFESGKHHFEVTRPQRVSDPQQSTGYRQASLQDKVVAAAANLPVTAYDFWTSDSAR